MKSQTYHSPDTKVSFLRFEENFCLTGSCQTGGQTDSFVVEEDETDNLF